MHFYFAAGERGNYLYSKESPIMATTPVPDGASEDYGYLTLKRAIQNIVPDATFWYDGQEQFLAPDADADCEVELDGVDDGEPFAML